MMRLTFCIIVGTIVIANSIRAAYVGKKPYQLNPRSYSIYKYFWNVTF